MSSQGHFSQPGTYVSVPMTTVIQHRGGLQTQQPQQQRPISSCSALPTSTSFYIQAASAHPPPGPTPTPTPTPTAQITASGNPGTSCSLAKLQQLTNGLDMIPPSPCSTMTPPPNLTPPPHATPPPQMSQRNLTPPTNLQTQVTLASYHKYYQTNAAAMAAASAAAAAASRSARPPAMVQRGSPGLMAQYPTLNGYRMTQQGPVALNTAGYITNTAGFINQAQIPVQMGVMQAQYQDPSAAAAAAAASQNTMYAAYGYINSSSLMQPLNGTMRRQQADERQDEPRNQ